VDRYIALSYFGRDVFTRSGLPAERIDVKPNGAPDMVLEPSARTHALFVGRLSPEKGIERLVRCWRRLQRSVALEVIGSGPAELALRTTEPNITWRGPQNREIVARAMSGARFLVIPSQCFESGPVVIAEACRSGTPVIVADIGAAAEAVHRHTIGITYAAFDDDALVNALRWAVDNPERMAELGRNARRLYEREYISDAQYRYLLGTYRAALETRWSGSL
jgi:glycosyltransferase involved in cell wall biosynthesis